MRFALISLAAISLTLSGIPCLDAQSSATPLQSTRTLSLGTVVRELSLDGEWQAGLDRHYDQTLHVPGLATDPTQPTPGTLWYKRTIDIPEGEWTNATLILKGARFAPEVYVNGDKVSSAEGGMAATFHRFRLSGGAHGKSLTLEIALHSLKDLDQSDASAVPKADLWRNNVSSYLWDSVILRLHGNNEITRITPASNLNDDTVALHWELKSAPDAHTKVHLELLDEHGETLAEASSDAQKSSGSSSLTLHHTIEEWSPEHPHLYRLRTELIAEGHIIDAQEQSYGHRSFTVQGLAFSLNGKPYPIRMGTVVWHRWTRDPEAREIAFYPKWFEQNIVLRLKSYGANALRFHLGLPPEEFLDLCDRDGLAVQMEWPFFHAIPASAASLNVQWKAWLDTAMRHPSVVIVQPWNETDGEQLKMARGVLDTLLQDYPPLVVNHRDVTAVHKYWWSLFENLGLYYDSATQFKQAAMVDEFGGDYLDSNGDPGSYPATREAFLRFLGRDSTLEERLQLQADANGRVAEYWRRLGVAGFSPFCILASPEDGNTWFLGPGDIPAPKPKPVWDALSAAWAQQSISLELWNRNFLPGETVQTPLWFFNDDDSGHTLYASVHIIDERTAQEVGPALTSKSNMQPHSSLSIPIDMPLPTNDGEWRIEARLDGRNVSQHPVISSWHVRTFSPQVPANLQAVNIGVPQDEAELRAMLQEVHLSVVPPTDRSARIVAGAHASWQRLNNSEAQLHQYESLLRSGKSIVLLDAGPQPLGVGYSSSKQLGGPLEGAPSVSARSILQDLTLFSGIKVSFREMAEPESTLQQATENHDLWERVPRSATWLWNGLRGGLIVPAADMQVTGLSGDAVLAIWQGRGADAGQIQAGSLYAYELAGYYAFADHADDSTVSSKLQQRIKSLVDDAPALKGVVNPNATITVTNISALYRQAIAGGEAETVTPLANAGKNLTRAPVVKLTFGPNSGTVVLSQLLTAGRLLRGHSESGSGIYGLRYDPVAVQFVLNMLSTSLKAN